MTIRCAQRVGIVSLTLIIFLSFTPSPRADDCEDIYTYCVQPCNSLPACEIACSLAYNTCFLELWGTEVGTCFLPFTQYSK